MTPMTETRSDLNGFLPGQRLTGWLLATIVLLAAQTGLAAEVTPSARVESFVSVRSAPQNGELLATLPVGQTAEMLATLPAHYQVRLADGTTGFVLRSYTSVIETPGAASVRAGELALHFIDVGQGDATLLVCPDNRTILVDAGSSSNLDANTVRDYLTEVLGPDNYQLDTLVITHADPEHFNLLPELLRGFSVGHVYHVAGANDYNSPPFSSWLGSLGPSTVTNLMETQGTGATTQLPQLNCGAARVQVLSAGLRNRENWRDARSIVLRVEYGDFSALLAADATASTETAIMERLGSAALASSVLKLAGHGDSRFGNSAAWLAAVQPRMAVISTAGEGALDDTLLGLLENSVERPDDNFHPLTIKRMRDGQARFHTEANYSGMVFSTADSGTIVVTSGGQGFALKLQPAAYR